MSYIYIYIHYVIYIYISKSHHEWCLAGQVVAKRIKPSLFKQAEGVGKRGVVSILGCSCCGLVGPSE